MAVLLGPVVSGCNVRPSRKSSALTNPLSSATWVRRPVRFGMLAIGVLEPDGVGPPGLFDSQAATPVGARAPVSARPAVRVLIFIVFPRFSLCCQRIVQLWRADRFVPVTPL